jgi:hypothetical protein
MKDTASNQKNKYIKNTLYFTFKETHIKRLKNDARANKGIYAVI